jgi:hypothetical protein
LLFPEHDICCLRPLGTLTRTSWIIKGSISVLRSSLGYVWGLSRLWRESQKVFIQSSAVLSVMSGASRDSDKNVMNHKKFIFPPQFTMS